MAVSFFLELLLYFLLFFMTLQGIKRCVMGWFFFPFCTLTWVLLTFLQLKYTDSFLVHFNWVSLVVHWSRTCLPMQETWVQSLGREDPL